ncbi:MULTISPECIES: hypothetical protein [unclassified Agarivorans]|uniref:hypothetical protein n=1 Tax=unclassified Agarivorans TaxID=2636026 RepID=UPI003D7E6205
MKYLVVLLMYLSLWTCAATSKTEDLTQIAAENHQLADLVAGIQDKHPSRYLELAGILFQQGYKRQAVKWFYVGQIRYRAYLKARPDLDPSADAALFASLMDTLGRPLNEYIAGDVDEWVEVINQAIDWHHSHADGFLGKASNQAVYAAVLNGLVGMRDHIAVNKDAIRRQRVENGLQNRE